MSVVGLALLVSVASLAVTCVNCRVLLDQRELMRRADERATRGD